MTEISWGIAAVWMGLALLASFVSIRFNLSVALVDPEVNPGGVCVYRGCIPSKALLHVAKLIDESRHAKAWGVEFGEPKVDLGKPVGRRQSPRVASLCVLGRIRLL